MGWKKLNGVFFMVQWNEFFHFHLGNLETSLGLATCLATGWGSSLDVVQRIC
jgi:hypothetical protein